MLQLINMPTPESSPSPVRLGLIGIGKHGEQSHLKSFANSSDTCTITAIADIDKKRMGQIAERFALEAYQTQHWQEVTSNENVDAVVIMTPDHLHTMQFMASIAAGKHVFCEKPLADRLTDYDKMNFALWVAEEKLIATTCHPRRRDPPFVTTKAILDQRELANEVFETQCDLGQPIGFDFSFLYHKPSKEGLHQSLMSDHLNHEIDLMNYFFGHSRLTNITKMYDDETRYEVGGFREDGIRFSFRGSRTLEQRIYQEDMRIRFERGDLTVDMYDGTMVLKHETKSGNYRTIRKESDQFKTDYDQRFYAINQHFINSIRGIEPPYLTHTDLRINTLAAIALRQSGRVRKKPSEVLNSALETPSPSGEWHISEIR